MDDPRKVWEMIYACIAIHNVIRITDPTVDTDLLLEILRQQREERVRMAGVQQVDNDDNNQQEIIEQSGKELRDRIAMEMWDDYRNRLGG